MEPEPTKIACGTVDRIFSAMFALICFAFGVAFLAIISILVFMNVLILDLASLLCMVKGISALTVLVALLTLTCLGFTSFFVVEFLTNAGKCFSEGLGYIKQSLA